MFLMKKLNRREILVGDIYRLYLFETWIEVADNNKMTKIYKHLNTIQDRYYWSIGSMMSFETRTILKNNQSKIVSANLLGFSIDIMLSRLHTGVTSETT